ncbi:HEAT repeat domain-containing protein [Bryobacter aggregatus]|uniref:HEAT repeat domain-containing protein n=1 Tax=Bryobacter aggregatus TaxID=360054 RepID=UPI0012BA9106|nr:HEAT repeat domain-containing protein [Bryobacter aggregatus]
MFNSNLYVKPLVTVVLLCSGLTAQDRPKDKIKNIESLAKQGQNAVPAIAAYQRDPDVSVRYAAAEALIQAGGVQAADALRTSCQDGSAAIQRLSIAGIVNFYKPGYVKQGIKAKVGAVGDKILRSNEEPVIDSFVIARPEDINAIRKVLMEGASREAKLDAAQALGTLRAKSALPDLYPLLKTKDDGMMLAALRAIETSGDKAAAQETVFLVRDLNDKIQSRAISINGIFKNEGALPDLAEVFSRGRSAKSKAAALEAIAMIGSPESKGIFEQNLDNRDGSLRGFAAEGLGRIGATDTESRIQTLFQGDDSARARLGQAFALVKFGQLGQGDFSPLTYLFNQLNSAAWNDYAKTYLGELCRSEAVRKELRLKVAAATKAEKIGLARILAAEGTAEDKEVVDALAHDRDPAVAQEGIKAARTLGARLP